MIEIDNDFVKIRTGTDPKTAMEKACKKVCKFILSNSKNFRTNKITIQLKSEEKR